MTKKVLLFLLSLVTCGLATAQLQVSIQPPPVNTLRETDLLQFTVNNPLPMPATAIVEVEVDDAGQNKVLSLRSTVVQLATGINRFSHQNLQLTSISYAHDGVRQAVSQTQTFPPGNYTVCIKITDYQTRMESGKACIEHTVRSTEGSGTAARKSSLKEHTRFYGSGYLEGFYATRQGTNSTVPPQYFRADAQPGVSLYNIPFMLNVFYSTENSRERQLMNIVNLRFDQNLFRTNMIGLVTEKMQLQELAQKKERLSALGNLRDLDNITKALQDPQMATDLANAKEYDNIKSSLGTAGLQDIGQLRQVAEASGKQAVSAFYEPKIKALELSIAATRNAPTPDSVAVMRQQARIDSLEKELKITVEKRDRALEKGTLPEEQVGKIRELSARYQALEKQYGNGETLRSRVSMVSKMTERQTRLRKAVDLQKTGLPDNLASLKEYDYGKLSDPAELKNQLRRFDLFKGGNKAFFGLRNLAVGNVFPVFSPFVLDGVQVIGALVEVNPGLFYLGAVGGKTRRITGSAGPEGSSYDRYMYGIRAGVGKIERSHFTLNILRGVDQYNDQTASDSLHHPEGNLIIGSEGQLSFFDRAVVVYGDGALSHFIKNQQAPVEDLGVYNSIQQKVPLLLPSNLASLVDYAYNAGASLSLFRHTTVLGVQKKYIGPGFRSFGAPFLRNDLESYEGKLEQRLLKNRVSLSGFYRSEQDNLISFKGITTRRTYWGTAADMRFKKLPYLRLMYAPIVQINTQENLKLQMAGLNTGYVYPFRTVPMSTTLALNNTFSAGTSDTTTYRTAYLFVNHTVTLAQKIQAGASYTINKITGHHTSSSIRVVDLTLSLMSGPAIHHAVGIAWSGQDGKVWGARAYYDVSYRFLRYLTASLRLNYNNLRDREMIANEFDESLATFRLGFNL